MVKDRPGFLVLPNRNDLIEVAARRLLRRVAEGADPLGVCLSGGSTPQGLYRLLRTSPWRNDIPWNRVHWFIGDERFVSGNVALSNMGAARRAFLDDLSPRENIHAVATNAATPALAAQLYETGLRAFKNKLAPQAPLFEMVLLGVGPDGHTASLFPGASALAERDKWVVAVDHPNVPPLTPRISMTLPCLASTPEMLFLVAGTDKRDIVRRIVAGEDFPATRARSATGETVWLLDAAAACDGAP